MKLPRASILVTAFATHMDRGPTTDLKFLTKLKSWLQARPDILVLIRDRCGGGAKDFQFFSSYEALSKRILELAEGTCITAFQQPQLPLRGVVDDDFPIFAAGPVLAYLGGVGFGYL